MNFKIALRHLKRNKLYAGLNILGLSLGIASFLIIYFFVQNELSFDQYHANKDKIYRLTQTNTVGDIATNAGISAAYAKPMSERIPEIEAYTRIEAWNKTFVFTGLADSVAGFRNLTVDQGFFEIFDLDLVEGVVPDFNSNPNTVLVSQFVADRQWNGAAIGKTIKVRGIPFQVVGVYEDLPKNSSLQGDAIFNIEAVNQWRKDSFTNIFMGYFDQLYMTLPEDANLEVVSEKMTSLFTELRGTDVEKSILGLQPLADIHFNFDVEDSLGRKTDIQMIYVFSAIAFFILFCSFFNYISMSIAQSLERTKEIGVRKVMGANRSRVYVQYLMESLILIVIASLLGIVILEALLPSLEELMERQLADSIRFSAELWAYYIVFILIVTALSALYPSLLSGHSKISDLLRNSHNTFKSAKWINGLSVFQVVVFMTLISVAFASNQQLRFMQNDNLGFDKENMLFIRAYGAGFEDHGMVLENEFRTIPGVQNLARAYSVPSNIMGTMRMRDYQDIQFYNFPVGLNYFETMGMDIEEGRTFREDDLGKRNIVLNEAAVKAMEIEGDPIGLEFETFNQNWKVVGIVKDFHFLSKKEEIKPTFFRLLDENEGSMMVKIDGANLRGTMDDIESAYTEVTGNVLNYQFLDENFDALYKDEQAMITMIQAGTAMAAMVAFLGLFGITGYAAKRRMKEMGIRKVLGASFKNIQIALNRSSLIKLGIAAALSIPLIFYWVNEWLNTFAYRIEFPILWVLAALILAGMVAFSTSLIHSIRAYLINPVEVLKDE